MPQTIPQVNICYQTIPVVQKEIILVGGCPACRLVLEICYMFYTYFTYIFGCILYFLFKKLIKSWHAPRRLFVSWHMLCYFIFSDRLDMLPGFKETPLH